MLFRSTDTEFNRFKARLNSVYTDDIFVLSGNIEEEIKDRMVDLVKELCEEGVKVVLDGEKEFIEHCLDFGLYGIKLNDRNTDGDVVETAKRYLEKGVKSILYSAPHKPSYVFTQNVCLKCENLKDSLVNTTGSADSMVAGYLYGVIRGASVEESFKYANAASLATCMSNDLGSKEKIEELFDKIEVSGI